MAWTTTDLDTINKCIAAGVKKVKYADKEVEYQDMESMLKAREVIRNELGLSPRPQRIYPTFSKGLNHGCD